MEVPLYGLAVGVAEDVSKGEGVRKEGHEIKTCSLIVSIHLAKLQQRRKHKRESKYPIVYIYIPQDIMYYRSSGCIFRRESVCYV